MSEHASESAPPPRRPLRRRLFRAWSNETVMALSALLISACALVVSIYEVQIMREQEKAMVYPHLSVGINYNNEGFYIYVKNSGTGLAKVRKVEIFLPEKAFVDWEEITRHFLPDGPVIGYDILRQNQFSGQVLPANESIILFGLPWETGSDTLNAAVRLLEPRLLDLQYRICYCSVMDDCWILENEQQPRPGKCRELRRQAFEK